MKNRKALFIILAVAVSSTLLVIPAYALTFPGLPTIPVTLSLNSDENVYPLAIALSNVPGGYNVTNGEYTGWCADLLAQIYPDTPYSAMLLSSNDLGSPWDKINYIVNNKQGTSEDVQAAIWLTLGFTEAQINPYIAVTPTAIAMYTGAVAGFTPTAGQLVTVKCDVDGAQDVLIELGIPPANNAYLVVRGSNNGIYYRTYDVTTETWDSWTGAPGSTPNSPAAAVINNELHLVVRGMSGDTIWHGYVNLTDNSFSGFTKLSGTMPSAPIMTGNSTHLCLVVRGSNNVIYYRFYEAATRVWGGWTAVPGGSTSSTPGAVLVDGALHVVVRGSSGDKIWHGSVDLGTGSFSGWALLSGTTPSPPVLTRNSTHLCLVLRGSNNVIYYRWFDLASEVWGGWTGFPYGSTPDVPAATIVGDSLQVVVRGMTGDYIWHGSLDLSTSSWSGWTLLDGTTPSKPVLTS